MAWLRIALMLPQNFLRDRGELDLENLAMAYVIAGVVATLYLAFLVLLSGMALPTRPDLDFGLHPYYVVMLSLPLLAIPLTGAMIFFTARAWRRHFWRRRGRIHYTLGTVAAVAYVPFLHYWNLLGYRF